MKTRIALFLILPALLLAQSKRDRQPETLVLAHVTVIDVASGVPKPDVTVVITGDRISDEVKRQGLSFVGHVPSSVSPAEASDAGQKSIEHLTGMRARAEAMADDRKAAGLFARFVKNETWHCPTLTVLRGKAYFGDENFMRDQRLKYISRRIKERWSQRIANRNEGNFANAKKNFQKELEIVGAMRKAGVQFLAGTDTGNPFCFPGFSLHDELALLVIAGLTPIEALQSATINPAKFLGLDKTLGTIEQGKIADLVLNKMLAQGEAAANRQ